MRRRIIRNKNEKYAQLTDSYVCATNDLLQLIPLCTVVQSTKLVFFIVVVVAFFSQNVTRWFFNGKATTNSSIASMLLNKTESQR